MRDDEGRPSCRRPASRWTPDCFVPASSVAGRDHYRRGITPGWADVYDGYIPDQYIARARAALRPRFALGIVADRHAVCTSSRVTMVAEQEKVLSEDVEERLAALRNADIVAGIPSFNNAATIGHVVQAVSAGLMKYFPEARSVIVNSDGGSTDGTPDIAAKTDSPAPARLLVRHPVHPVQRVITPYHGIPGKGSAFRAIFAAAERLGARACAVFDSDLRSINPEWVELLLSPIYHGRCDYVAPFYQRHKYDGTITNTIVYPLTRALYGKRVRQPIGGEFGFSGELARLYLAKEVWDTNVARFGIDIWMTTTALAEGYRVCQAFLGAKLHDPKDPGADLSSMLVQVVSSLFGLMETYQGRWEKVTGSRPVPTFGLEYSVAVDPVAVRTDRMAERFRLGTREMQPLWQEILQPSVASEIVELARRERFRFPDELWAAAVYDFAVAYHQRKMNRERLLRSMTPLYLGRVASFVRENADCAPEQVEARIESLARAFETQKSELVRRWSSRP